MIKWFEAIKAEDLTLVGGKGGNLARMYNEGIAVPKGFVVLSTAYDTYIKVNDYAKVIEGLLLSPLPLESRSEAIRRLFSMDKVPENLKATILENFSKIESGRVAVRSSSTVEDLPGMSFAGQYTSYLNVQSEDLLEKVLECWQSLWNVRAMDYRLKNKVTENFSHAVVVQEMVEAKTSGVVFTANPVNGLRHQMVVNASWGLGEAIVSGLVNPDQYLIDRNDGRKVEVTIHKKHMKYRYGTRGIEEVALGQEEGAKACLEDKALEELRKAADRAEAYFGKPQDMEFAFDSRGSLYILQSRDITTLYPIDALTQDGKLRPYMSASTVLLGVREPFTPLGYDLMSQMFPTIINVMTARKKNPLTNSFVSYAGGRIFVDMSYLLSSKFVAKQFANSFSGNDLPLKGVMEDLMATYGKTLKKQGIRFRMPLGFLKYGFSMAFDMRKIIKIPNKDRYEALIDLGNTCFKAIQDKYDQAKTTEERLDFAHEALIEAFQLSQAQAAYCLDANNYIKIDKVLKKHFGNTYKVETLVQSLDGCITQTMTMDLNRYAGLCDHEGKEPSPQDPEFKTIIEKYGVRANTELDFGTQRWHEKPDYLLRLVKSYMEDRMYERNLKDHEVKRQMALEMIEEVTQKLVGKIGKGKAAKFRTYMINYRYGAAMREYPKYDIVRFLDLARKSVQGIGRQLVAEGLLDEANDVFFLRREQMLQGGDFKVIVNEAKEAYDKEMKRKTVPRILLNNGHTYYNATTIDPNSDLLQGQALSAGVYEGVIRVVYDPLNTQLQEGEVMVTETTNPAWTPLFATAGALIMAYGGPMSHGGIVAREYGIPAVVGIPSATETLKDGQRVRVNGETGTIELL